MLIIFKKCWNKNKKYLKETLSTVKMESLDYKSLVKLTFQTIYNDSDIKKNYPYEKLNLNEISIIDNGDYQGTLLFVIPFDTYQPSEYEYLMTYVGYGSCSGCDTLQAITRYEGGRPSEDQVKDLLTLCKDIVTNTIKPYNAGWRNDIIFDPVEE